MKTQNKYIIIFEGVDNTGKTTIAKKLASVLNIQYFKNLIGQQSFIQDYFYTFTQYTAPMMMALLKQVKFYDGGIILDRFTPSEHVYATVFDRKYDNKLIRKIDTELSEIYAVIIYCYRTDFDTWSDTLISKKHTAYLMNEYDNYLAWSKMFSLKLDTTDQNLDDQITKILSFLASRYQY